MRILCTWREGKGSAYNPAAKRGTRLHLIQGVQGVVNGGYAYIAGHVSKHTGEVNGVAHYARRARQDLCKGGGAANNKHRLHAGAALACQESQG